MGLRWYAGFAAGLAMAACGEVEKAKTKAGEAVVQELVLQRLDDDSTFTGTVSHSPLKLAKFNGRVSIFSAGRSASLGRKLEIKSGSSTLNLAPDAVNVLQGLSLQVYRWNGEKSMPIVNPKEPPADGPFAVVAYSEILRDNAHTENNRDWFTYHSLDGTLNLSVVDTSDKGGAKGSVGFTVRLIDPNRRPATLEELPVVKFTGKFNVRHGAASELYTGR
jgi:hypothetical protein